MVIGLIKWHIRIISNHHFTYVFHGYGSIVFPCCNYLEDPNAIRTNLFYTCINLTDNADKMNLNPNIKAFSAFQSREKFSALKWEHVRQQSLQLYFKFSSFMRVVMELFLTKLLKKPGKLRRDKSIISVTERVQITFLSQVGEVFRSWIYL